jgi:hypothetical protein
MLRLFAALAMVVGFGSGVAHSAAEDVPIFRR